MARSRETKIELTAYDDLFQTDESREEAKLSKIRDIPISEIDEFPDHPFKVLMDEDMEQLVESIKRSPVPCVPVGELELPAYYDSSQQTIFVKKGLSEEVLFVSMAKEVSAAVYDFKHNESRDASDFKSFCVAYMVSSRYGVDTRGFDFSRLPREYAEMDTQAFKGELGAMRDVLGEIQSDMYKSMEKNKPAKNKEQER